MAENLYLGVDVGGTKVAAGLVNSRGELLYKARVPMYCSGTDGEAFACICKAIDEVIAANPQAIVSGIGVASPGPLDPRSGVILFTPNLPCFRNFPLREKIEAAYKLPTHVDNDANAAGLAEALFGAGRGYSSVFCATIGTGIGTAIVFDGKLYYGRTGLAAEGGHQTIDFNAPILCECGKHGCFESYASGTGISRRARAAVAAAPERGVKLLELANDEISRIDGHAVADAWRAGDPLATEILTETARLMTVWLGNTIDLLEPDVIVIGGGMGEVFSHFFPQILRDLPSWSLNERCAETPLLLAQYGGDAGIIGAAALCVSNANALCAVK